MEKVVVVTRRTRLEELRAVAMRKIKPLGSDSEIGVDVRLVAATNADLTELIDRRLFREDLYFRLKVITLHTPALREHKENIPALALAYLRQAESLVNKQGLALSRGALEKMKAYSWPGNIRELINCITRAAVMAEGDLILADWSYYLIGDRQQVVVDWSDHVAFLNLQSTVRLYERVDGKPWMDATHTPRKGAARSPFIILT